MRLFLFLIKFHNLFIYLYFIYPQSWDMFVLQSFCFVRNLCNIEFGVRECAVLCWLPSSSSALPGLSSGGRWGLPVLPMCPLASEEKKKRERAAASHIPAFALSSSPSFLFSLRKGSTTPCQPIRTQLHPLHHIISVSKVTGRPLSLSLSLPLCFQTERCRIIIIIPPIRPFTPPSHTELVASLALASPVLASSLSLARSLSFCSGIATTSTAPPFSSLCIL